MVDHNHFDFDFDDDEVISMIKLFDEQEIVLLIFVENEERRYRKPNIIRNRQHTLDLLIFGQMKCLKSNLDYVVKIFKNYCSK